MSGSVGTFPRHVLMTADTVGGVWTYAMDLCAELCSRGVRVSLATMGDPVRPHQAVEAARIRGLDVYESRFRLEWMDDPWHDVMAAGEWLLALQKRTGADLVHLNGYVHAALPWPVPVVVVAHSCVLSWWRAVKKEDAPDSYNQYRHQVTCGVRAADMLVAPSAWMLDQVRLHYSPLNGGVVVPNARSGSFAPGEKEDLIFSCGRIWDEAKNIGSLCWVAPLLQWPVAVAGETRHPDGRTMVLSRVQLLGSLSQTQIANWLAKASIYALPAYYEPFGLSAVEAALSGCALVLGRIGSLQEIWEDDAVYVTPNDEGELIGTINGLIANPERRHDLAARGRKRARAFTSERMVSGYVEVYDEARRRFSDGIDPVRRPLEATCVS